MPQGKKKLCGTWKLLEEHLTVSPLFKVMGNPTFIAIRMFMDVCYFIVFCGHWQAVDFGKIRANF